jgi:hypothetical protein
MRLLDAAIAFAICIAGFATVITVIVEVLHRVLRLRAQGLRQTLEMVYAEEILPAVNRTFTKGDATLRKELKAWVSQMGESPLKGTRLARWYPDALSGANRLSSVDFLKRMADTDLFKTIRQDVQQKSGELLLEFSKSYEEYGAAMSEYFTRRAQALSVIAGVALALGTNIDGIRLFERFLSDPALAARMEVQSEQLQKTLEKSRTSDVKKEASADDIKAGVETVSKLASSLADMQLPIGWGYYPGCTALPLKGSALDTRCADAGVAKRDCAKSSERCDIVGGLKYAWANDLRGLLTWIFTVGLTGLLIGLGGPFWFDVAKKLAAVRDSAKGGQKADAQQAAQAPQQSEVERTIAEIVARPVSQAGSSDEGGKS